MYSIYRYSKFMIVFVFIILHNTLTYSYIPSNISKGKSAINSYSGMIGDDVPIRLILQHDDDSLRGNYYDTRVKEMFYLRGAFTTPAKDFVLREYFIDEYGHWQQIGLFKGKFASDTSMAGQWNESCSECDLILQEIAEDENIHIPEKEKFPFKLTWEKANYYSPLDIKNKILSLNNKTELHFFIFRQLIGLDWENLYYYPFILVRSEIESAGLSINIFYENLFGDEEKEAVFQFRFQNAIYFTFFFYKENDKWIKIPEHLTFNRRVWKNKACCKITDDYRYFNLGFEEVLQEDQYLISGRTYTGSCDYNNRGKAIFYYLWQINKQGIKLVHKELEDSYWYNLKDKMLFELPEKNKIEIVSSENSAFPKQIKCTETIYKFTYDEKMKINGYEEDTTRIEYIPIVPTEK